MFSIVESHGNVSDLYCLFPLVHDLVHAMDSWKARM
jgi:hypothetical protein